MFTQKYQEMRKGMNLEHMMYTTSLKAYMRNFNAQINATPKMNKYDTRYIFLSKLQKRVVDVLFKFLKKKNTRSLDHETNTKVKLKVQLPTNIATKEESNQC